MFVDGYSSQSGKYQMKVTITPPVCGNGILEVAEECEDGNTATGDGCDGSCHWEGTCGAIAEAGETSTTAPQVIPAGCKSFIVNGAMTTGDADYYQVDLPANMTIEAWTFVGSPGQCQAGADTVMSIWAGTISSTNATGGCNDDGYVTGMCNDTDLANGPCSHVGPYTVQNNKAGIHTIKVNNFSSTSSIAAYGLRVLAKQQ